MHLLCAWQKQTSAELGLKFALHAVWRQAPRIDAQQNMRATIEARSVENMCEGSSERVRNRTLVSV